MNRPQVYVHLWPGGDTKSNLWEIQWMCSVQRPAWKVVRETIVVAGMMVGGVGHLYVFIWLHANCRNALVIIQTNGEFFLSEFLT